MAKKIVFSCGCCVIKYINNFPHVLLVQPSLGRNAWGIPKGHIEKGETYEQCAIRETREETGIDVKIIMPLPTVKTFYREEIKYVKSYLAVPSQNDSVISGDGENANIKFFPINNLPPLHIYQNPLINNLKFLVEYGVVDDLAIGSY